MCGIVGIIHKKKRQLNFGDLNLFKDMMIADAIRGEDSTGAFSVNANGNVEFVKISTNPFNLFKTSAYSEWEKDAVNKGSLVVGHNRKATTGAVVNANAHPFTFGPICLVHNGGIDNFRSLLPIKEREKHGVEVDSHAATVLLARNPVEKIIPEMNGAFALVWYNANEKSMNFIRNEERPLAFVDTPDRVFFASEGHMLSWLLGRRGFASPKIINLKPGIHISLDIENEAKLTSTKVALYQKKVYSGPTNHSYESVNDDVRNVVELPRQPNPTFNFRSNRRPNGFKSESVVIPAEDKWNIHYGGDEPVELEAGMVQQIVFEIEDYKEAKDSDDNIVLNTYILWGKALDSSAIEIKFNFVGDKKSLEALVYSKYCIGVIDRVNTKLVDNVHITRVAVKGVRSIELHTTEDGMHFEKEHYAHFLKKEVCDCDVELDSFDTKEQLHRRCGLTTKVQCTWCRDAEEQQLKEEQAKINAKNPNSAL